MLTYLVFAVTYLNPLSSFSLLLLLLLPPPLPPMPLTPPPLLPLPPLELLLLLVLPLLPAPFATTPDVALPETPPPPLLLLLFPPPLLSSFLMPLLSNGELLRCGSLSSADYAPSIESVLLAWSSLLLAEYQINPNKYLFVFLKLERSQSRLQTGQ